MHSAPVSDNDLCTGRLLSGYDLGPKPIARVARAASRTSEAVRTCSSSLTAHQSSHGRPQSLRASVVVLRIPLFPQQGRPHQRTQASCSPLSNRSPDRLGQQAITLCGAAFFTAPDDLLCVPQSLNGLAVTLGVADLEAVAPQRINR